MSCTTWSARHFTPCAIPGPGPAVALPAGVITYNTDLPGFVEDPPVDPPALALAQGGTEAVLISVDSFTIPAGSTLRVIGARPLVIASWSTIDIQGVLDVGSSRAANRVGAGSNPALCAANAAMLGDDESGTEGGSGGGGGGAFGGNGGKGGPGDTGGENPGGNGGSKVVTPAIVRGGCSGAAGGKAGPGADPPSDANTVATGGAGGGAIQLSARVSITVGASGRVRAGGAGGGAAPLGSAAGGGGGGAGGYIGFDAPAYSFVANARIAANGGGGGTSALFAEAGAPGGDGTDDATQAPGGTYSDPCAQSGPPGAAGTTLDGPNASTTTVNCGGAGGGGGVGHIVVFGTFVQPANVVFSPKSNVVP